MTKRSKATRWGFQLYAGDGWYDPEKADGHEANQEFRSKALATMAAKKLSEDIALRVRVVPTAWDEDLPPLGKNVPFHGGRKCYACDAVPVGLSDQRPSGGMLEVACTRHADPRIRVFKACSYCSGPRPTRVIEGVFHHKSCHEEASR